MRFPLFLLGVAGLCSCGRFQEAPTEDGGTPPVTADGSSMVDAARPDDAAAPLDGGDGGGATPSTVLHLAFNENMGVVAKDSSSNMLDATLADAAGWTPGRLGSALLLDGANYARVVNTPALNLPPEFTLSLWVNIPLEDQTLIGKTSSWQLRVSGMKLELVGWVNGAMHRAKFDDGIPENTWHHVAFTFSKGSVAGYLDAQSLNVGTPQAFVAGSVIDNSANDLIVGGKGDLSGFANGAIDDLRVYNTVLPPPAIVMLANGQ